MVKVIPSLAAGALVGLAGVVAFVSSYRVTEVLVRRGVLS